MVSHQKPRCALAGESRPAEKGRTFPRGAFRPALVLATLCLAGPQGATAREFVGTVMPTLTTMGLTPVLCSRLAEPPKDLRLPVGAQLFAGSIPIHVVGKILNHVETGVTAVYDRHSYDAEKRAALDLWGRELQRILGKRAKSPILSFAPPESRRVPA